MKFEKVVFYEKRLRSHVDIGNNLENTQFSCTCI